MSELGERLAELRMDKQERQKEIADLLNVSAGSISNYETGVHLPTVDALSTLAEHFGVTMDYLAGRTKCRTSIEVLNQQFTKQMTCGEFLERLMVLPDNKRKLLLELVQDMEISCYVKNHTANS